MIRENTVLVKAGADKEEKTAACRAFCAVFWLCRLMLLEAMKEKFGQDLTPERWILWSNDGGQNFLSDLQAIALYKLR